MIITVELLLLSFILPFTLAQFSTSGCGDTKGCVLSPQGCQASSCLRAFTYSRVNSTVLEMELMARTPYATDGFVAVGFSRDTFMGDDTVTQCASFNGGPYQGSLSYNPGKSNVRLEAPQYIQDEILQTVEARYENGKVYCRLRQQLRPSGNLPPNQVQSLDSSFYILMATGRTANNALEPHNFNRNSDEFPFSTAQPINLLQYSQREAPLGVDLGGMNGTSLGPNAVPSAQIDAPESDYVFTLVKIHRTLNIIGIAAMIAGFVCIFIARDWQWKGPKGNQSQELNREWPSVHAMLGLLACVVAWAQPIGAIFRCDPHAKLRFIFHIVHGFFGFGAWVMAAAAIMIACVHFDPRFLNRDAALGLFIAFLCVIGLTMIGNEFLTVYQWWQRRHTVVSSDMEMIQVNGKTHVTVSPENRKINRIRLVIFVFASLVSIGTAVAISAMLGTVKPPLQ
ncbi:hypothetical protein QR680_000926 [Steinernema hermaphroditum]|uniref:DOMON domain-containing protein n=1 Tax=Steinernema hermaphroditum TaxID=289476 RepID=A0AA39LEY1_9BILA|nr:hypothetical protein QR680_000926 [Steinernema hermaphroditum]